MSDQIKIPCMFMRGGTSRGPYFLKKDLPEDITKRDKILLAVVFPEASEPVIPIFFI